MTAHAVCCGRGPILPKEMMNFTACTHAVSCSLRQKDCFHVNQLLPLLKEKPTSIQFCRICVTFKHSEASVKSFDHIVSVVPAKSLFHLISLKSRNLQFTFHFFLHFLFCFHIVLQKSYIESSSKPHLKCISKVVLFLTFSM